jgi:REP element-mobilizing transposase RayT
MRFDPKRHHRRSIRLRGYDYSQLGAYFVTICVQDRECLFGEVVEEEMRLNDAGRMVQDVWNDLPRYYPGVALDAFVVMPNHIHGIIILVGAGPCACPDAGQPIVGAGPRACPDAGQPQGVARTLGLPDVVHRFKTMTTKRYTDGVKRFGWLPFRGRLWQRNYYEHIIRNEESLYRIREYILTNPMRWMMDCQNPHRQGVDPLDEWASSFRWREGTDAR